jgi:hypothetical protein
LERNCLLHVDDASSLLALIKKAREKSNPGESI